MPFVGRCLCACIFETATREGESREGDTGRYKIEVAEMGGGDGGASWKLKKAAKKIFVQTCGSFCHRQEARVDNSTATSYVPAKFHIPPSSSQGLKNLCAICLDPLNYSSGSSPGEAIFTAQCSHAFHFACISSNVRHGSVTCPICRAHWTQLPRNLNLQCALHSTKADPILQILDDSIANSRVHRPSDGLSGVLTTPHRSISYRYLLFSRSACFSAQAHDFVREKNCVASHRSSILYGPGGSDGRAKERSENTRDRVHKNTQSCILHLTDSPSGSYHQFDMEAQFTIHRFHVGFGFGASNGFDYAEFEEFLARTLGGAIRDIQMRIEDGTRIVRIGELRGGEERNIPVYLGECGPVCVEYSYVEGGDGECVRRGEVVVGLEDKGDRSENGDGVPIGGRMSSVENWDYHDPFMARRWAKHLHGYRL
ncbi:hypothetical protein DH2020_042352 [Rehmannia glutinosa]|uniref:RING-type domain-containing protein n=1 Tax=Rehmannia glutinosa TaxID=99300 RepID=A0ABR0UMM4_REHGL